MMFPAPLKDNSISIMLLGSGELGKEVAIEAQNLGIEVIAVDSYENAPAHLVANEAVVVDMQDMDALLGVIEMYEPNYIVPEIEAINVDALLKAEELMFKVIPNAKAVSIAMNRKSIRELAAKELGLKTSKYTFVKTLEELQEAAKEIGFPCVVKPIMSSSGHGQSIVTNELELETAFLKAKHARGDSSELIVEEFIEFDYEITLITARNDNETLICEPIGHLQEDGDYVLSWQPMPMSEVALKKAQDMAKKITEALGGRGVFGVELFVKGDEVYFSEVSPRPHDTGMVTIATQSQSEFALHVRAILNLPLNYTFLTPGASAAYKAKRESKNPVIEVPDFAFSPQSFVRIFGKPESYVGRRMAVALAINEDVEKAKEEALKIIKGMNDY